MGLAQKLFYCGEYSGVLEKTFRKTQAHKRPPEIIYIIGSLSFLSRIGEAQALFEAHESRLTALEKSYCYFFLGIGFTRRSQYKQAKRYFMLNLKLSQQLPQRHAHIQFLVRQGISFYLYYLGQFGRSLQWSEKSLVSAFASRDVWMRALANDLIANNLVQNGRIHEGLRYFDEALKDAQHVRNNSMVAAIQTSSIVFRAEYGIDLKMSLQTLTSMYQKSAPDDGFSRANLGLEYARQLTLQGQFAAAEKILTEISTFIFSSQNRRQEARYNLRWAELSYLKNEVHSCQHYIRSGRRCLEFVDYTYEMQFLGIEKKMYQDLLGQKVPESILLRLNKLAHEYDNVKNNNILNREKSRAALKAITNDDRIHRYLVQAQKNESKARQIILETGYFSWLYRFFDFQKGERYLALHLEPKSITLLTRDGILHRTQALSTLNYKILTTLASGFTTKEDLMNKVWGYQYDPLRHDSLIYTTFSNLRKIFIPDSQVIETSELGYSLNAQLVDLSETSGQRELKSTSTELQPLVSAPDVAYLADHDLNYRQIQILQYLKRVTYVSVKDVVKLFKTSEITANRDLRSLFQKKLVVRVGQGRVTRYTLKR